MALVDNCTHYWKMDEASGNSADSVGSITLTATNITRTTGLINNCAVYSGNYAQAYSADGILKSNNAWSISCWFYITAQPTAEASIQNIFYVRNNGYANAISLDYRRTSADVYKFDLNNIGSDSVSTQTETLNTWHHYVIVFDTSNFNFYRDGSYVFNKAKAGSQSVNAFTIGNFENSYGRPLVGRADECGLWTRALSTGEITSLYNSGAGLAYPFNTGPTNLKTYNTNAKANIKTINTNAIANVKTLNTNA